MTGAVQKYPSKGGLSRPKLLIKIEYKVKVQ